MANTNSTTTDMECSRAATADFVTLIQTDFRIAQTPDHASAINHLSRQETDGYAQMWRGLIEWWQGDYKRCWKSLHAASKLLPSETRIPWYQAILVKDHSEYHYWKRFELARHWIQTVLDKYPTFEPALDYRSYISGYYSQLGQDTLAEDFFSHNPQDNPIFLDVGAFDGISLSNSRRLFELGWKGVCVEPVGQNFDKLQQLYAGTPIHCVRCAVSTKPGQQLITVAATGSSLIAEHQKASVGFNTELVELRSLNQILESLHIIKVDFLSIDCEGVDFDVLQSIDLTRYKPKLVVIEHNCDANLISQLNQHMRLHNYVFLHNNAQDLFYRASDTNPLPNFWNIKTLLPIRQMRSTQDRSCSWQKVRYNANPSQERFSKADLAQFLDETINSLS